MPSHFLQKWKSKALAVICKVLGHRRIVHVGDFFRDYMKAPITPLSPFRAFSWTTCRRCHRLLSAQVLDDDR